MLPTRGRSTTAKSNNGVARCPLMVSFTHGQKVSHFPRKNRVTFERYRVVAQSNRCGVVGSAIVISCANKSILFAEFRPPVDQLGQAINSQPIVQSSFQTEF
jgi:hypothetical protein